MFDPGTAFDRMADMSRRNLEELQRSLTAFAGQPPAPAADEPAADEEESEVLERKVRDLEQRIAELERTRGSGSSDGGG